MAIIRTIPTANFTLVSNELFNLPMAFKARDVLLHLLEKPSDWKVIKSAICKQLELSKYIVDKSLQWLRKKGYAIYRASKHGGGQWYIFDTPQPKTAAIPANTPHLVSPNRAIPTPFTNTQTNNNTQKTTTTTEPHNIVTPEPVVVSPVENDALVYPELTPKQKTAVKSIAKQLKEPEMTQELLFTLAYAIANGHIKSSLPGYFRRLVDAANEGRYTAIERAGATKPDTRHIDKTQEQLEAYRTVNKSEPSKAAGFFAAMRQAVGKS